MREIKITDDEATTVGVFKDTPDGWIVKIKPLLIQKGVPEKIIGPNNAFFGAIRRDSDGVVFGMIDQ